MAAAFDRAPVPIPVSLPKLEAGAVASRCAALARGGGATRRELARAAGRFALTRGWERLGFARLSDYAVERLGISGRELQDLARVDAALASLPRISEALVAGRISWTKTRLVARVATAGDEERWLEVAKAISARELAHEVRQMDVGSLEGSALAEDEVETSRRETLSLRCTPRVVAKWHRARLLASRVAGQPLAAWQCAEAVAAEVLSAVPLAAIDVPADGETTGVASVQPEPARAGAPERLERRARASSTERSAEPLDAFALDELLRDLVAAEQKREASLAAVLLGVAEGRHYRSCGFPTLDEYAREALGMSPRKARMLLRVARATRRVPRLGAAWRSGQLSFLRAYSLAPVVLVASAHTERWIDRACRATCLRLEEEVSAALAAAELDPDRFATHGGLPESNTDAADDASLQVGAQATVARAQQDEEVSQLMVNGPRDVMRLIRATLCTVRRRIERDTGRAPSPGEAFEAMLDHAFDEWLPRGKQRGRRARKAQRVYERDGWRCTVPGCSSMRNLQDHHIVFRSRGGSNALANRTTLCAWHHLRGVHAGRVGCAGTAPNGLRFELGRRPGRPPLLVYDGRGTVSLPAPTSADAG